MKRLGMIVRMDKSGLGFQSKRLCRMLKPDKIMLIDSTPFNGNEQHPDWYKDIPATRITGFPNDWEVGKFCRDVDTVITAESFYNNRFVNIARQNHTKTIQIFNYEFWDNLRNPYMGVPDVLIQPSPWMLETMQSQYPHVRYLPTPIFEDEFEETREFNLKRKGKRKYLFMNGKTAAHDRNGLEILYSALEHSKGDFTVTIKAQNNVKKHPDPRLIYDFSNPVDQGELYRGFDALVFPRRYGGQALSMTEALLCSLPVIMTDVDPNNKVLPNDWLVPAYKKDQFMTRTMIDIYTVEPSHLAHKLDNLDISLKVKQRAYDIGKQFEAESLRSKYKELIK